MVNTLVLHELKMVESEDADLWIGRNLGMENRLCVYRGPAVRCSGLSSVCSLGTLHFSSVAQLCPTLCDPMNRSTPGLPVHHQLPEFTQTHAHWVGDAIQPSHPLSSPSPPAPNPSQHQGLSNESTLRVRWPKYWHPSAPPYSRISCISIYWYALNLIYVMLNLWLCK